MNKKLNMKPHGGTGKLITFCGLDGSGKSTMIKMLETELALEGEAVFVTKQPTQAMRQTEIFRNFMDSKDNNNYDYRALSLMAAADRIQHSNNVILPYLLDDTTVISDRYIYSCLANLRARGYENDKWIYEIAQYIPKPDIAFFLYVPVEKAIERVRSRPEERDRYIDVDFQHRLLEEYKNICRENDGILVPSDQSIEETYRDILKCVI